MPTEALWLDWELEAKAYSCTITSGDFPAGARFALERGDDFSLRGEVRVPPSSPAESGEFPHVVNFAGRTTAGAEATISNAFVRRRTRTNDGTFIIQLEPQQVSIKYPTKSTNRLVEWLANFDSDLLFPNSSDTSVNVSISRKRPSEAWSSEIEFEQSSSMSRDHIELRCEIEGKGVAFLLGSAEAPSKRAVRAGFIEYLDQGAGLPDENAREQIRSGLSFIFDRQLVFLAETSLDASLQLTGAGAIAAKYLGAQRLLQNSAELPAPIYDQSRTHVISERRVSDLLQLFIENNSHFRLERIVQKMWDARTSTLDTRIAGLVAAIESLRDLYLGDAQSLLPKKEWAKISTAMTATLKATARELQITDERAITHLANKLPNINFSSSTKQFDIFFENLKLTISDAEQKAMDARNDQAHGALYEREHYKELLASARRVQVLFNRVVLSLMRYKGMYNNHTQFPHSERQLAEPSSD